MTAAGSSPAANRRSASRRNAGHEYDPGRVRPSDACRTRCRWASSACRLRQVRTPDAVHTAARRSTKSFPERRRRNASPRCVSQSQIETPCVKCSRARGPRPACPQIAQGGQLDCTPVPKASSPRPPRRPPRPLPGPPPANRSRCSMAVILTPGTVTARHPDVSNRHKSHSFHVTLGRRGRRQMAGGCRIVGVRLGVRRPHRGAVRSWARVRAVRSVPPGVPRWPHRRFVSGPAFFLQVRPALSGRSSECRTASRRSGRGPAAPVARVMPRRRPRWPAVGRSGHRRRLAGATTSGRSPG